MGCQGKRDNVRRRAPRYTEPNQLTSYLSSAIRSRARLKRTSEFSGEILHAWSYRRSATSGSPRFSIT